MFIDKKLKNRGFNKIEEDEYGVTYEKEITEFGYTQVLSLICKADGRHIIQSYDKRLIPDEELGAVNSVCGLTLPDTLLILLKSIYMRIRYHWK